MGCDRADLLIGLLEGELDPAEQAEVEGHLAGCAACREARDAYGAALGEVRALPAERPSADATARAYAAVIEAMGQAGAGQAPAAAGGGKAGVVTKLPARRRTALLLQLAAAAACLLLVAALSLPGGAGAGGAVARRAPLAPVAADRAEQTALAAPPEAQAAAQTKGAPAPTAPAPNAPAPTAPAPTPPSAPTPAPTSTAPAQDPTAPPQAPRADAPPPPSAPPAAGRDGEAAGRHEEAKAATREQAAARDLDEVDAADALAARAAAEAQEALGAPGPVSPPDGAARRSAGGGEAEGRRGGGGAAPGAPPPPPAAGPAGEPLADAERADDAPAAKAGATPLAAWRVTLDGEPLTLTLLEAAGAAPQVALDPAAPLAAAPAGAAGAAPAGAAPADGLATAGGRAAPRAPADDVGQVELLAGDARRARTLAGRTDVARRLADAGRDARVRRALLAALAFEVGNDAQAPGAPEGVAVARAARVDALLAALDARPLTAPADRPARQALLRRARARVEGDLPAPARAAPLEGR